jgi:hypothetical protein
VTEQPLGNDLPERFSALWRDPGVWLGQLWTHWY